MSAAAQSEGYWRWPCVADARDERATFIALVAGHAWCEAQHHLDVLRMDVGNAISTSTRHSTRSRFPHECAAGAIPGMATTAVDPASLQLCIPLRNPGASLSGVTRERCTRRLRRRRRDYSAKSE